MVAVGTIRERNMTVTDIQIAALTALGLSGLSVFAWVIDLIKKRDRR